MIYYKTVNIASSFLNINEFWRLNLQVRKKATAGG